MSLARPLSCAALLSLALGCGVPPPDRLEITPPTPIKHTEQGAQAKLKIAAYRGVVAHDEEKAPLTVTWSTSDATVADVSQDGTVTATGSGKAQVTASVPGKAGAPVTASVEVNNVMVSTIDAVGDFPKSFSLSSKPVQLKVTVKDEKGNVVEKPKLNFTASDYCVRVSPDGLVEPLAVGECSVIIESAGKRAQIPLDVKD